MHESQYTDAREQRADLKMLHTTESSDWGEGECGSDECRIYASERWLYLMHAWQGTVLDILVGGMLSGTAFAIAVVEASVSPGKAGVLLTTTLIASAYLSSCPQALSNVIKRAERVGSVLRKQTN